MFVQFRRDRAKTNAFCSFQPDPNCLETNQPWEDEDSVRVKGESGYQPKVTRKGDRSLTPFFPTTFA